MDHFHTAESMASVKSEEKGPFLSASFLLKKKQTLNIVN